MVHRFGGSPGCSVGSETCSSGVFKQGTHWNQNNIFIIFDQEQLHGIRLESQSLGWLQHLGPLPQRYL